MRRVDRPIVAARIERVIASESEAEVLARRQEQRAASCER
jgi:hypothetical protein